MTASDLTQMPGAGAPVLVIARSARMLAELAREAGWVPHVIDLFGDLDTREIAASSIVVPSEPGFSFARDLPAAVDRCIRAHGDMPVLAGSGFEHAPHLLAAIAGQLRLSGSTPAAIQRLIDAPSVFKQLHDDARIESPETRSDPPADLSGWLLKRRGASGGFHVRSAAGRAAKSDYYQRFVDGPAISALYLADAEGSELMAVHQQLRWQTGLSSYRYEGAMRLAQPDTALSAVLARCGREVARRCLLSGLFGLDFIWHKQRGPLLIDINPRPPASLELHPARGVLLDAHLRACVPGPLLYSKPVGGAVSAHLVMYAGQRWRVPDSFCWPVGTADRAAPGTHIARGAPLCTIRASAADPEDLFLRLVAEIRTLASAIGRFAPAVIPQAITISTVGGALHGTTQA